MLFSILNFFFSTILLILFIRYFVEKYRFYGFGPVMVTILTLTERILRPLKQIIPKSSLHLEEHLPLVAIGVTLLIRGIVIWILGESTLLDLVRIHGVSGRISILYAVAVSFSMGIQFLAELLIAFLFASLMISRQGVMMGGNAGFMCFQERTFAIFQWTQKYVKTNNLVSLFLISSIAILVIGSFLSSGISLTFLYGSKSFTISFILCLFDILLALIQIYWMVLLLAILASWIGADHFSMIVQMVRAISDPYLRIFQRWMPWARIDFIDLSPIFAFLCLNPGLVYVLMTIRVSLLHSILPSMLI